MACDTEWGLFVSLIVLVLDILNVSIKTSAGLVWVTWGMCQLMQELKQLM